MAEASLFHSLMLPHLFLSPKSAVASGAEEPSLWGRCGLLLSNQIPCVSLSVVAECPACGGSCSYQ